MTGREQALAAATGTVVLGAMLWAIFLQPTWERRQELDRQEERLALAYPKPEVFKGVQGLLAALGRIKGRPQRIRDRDFQERTDGGQRGV